MRLCYGLKKVKIEQQQNRQYTFLRKSERYLFYTSVASQSFLQLNMLK